MLVDKTYYQFSLLESLFSVNQTSDSKSRASNQNQSLTEVSMEAIKNKEVIPLDRKGEWYVMPDGKTLRHTKIMFKTDAQQKRFCQAYRYHDPTKAQDKCIYVLLCINYDKNRAFAITTIRKINARCIRKYWHDWIIVPKGVLDRLIKHLKQNKLADDKTIQMLEQVKAQAKPKGGKDKYLMIDELWSKLRKRKR